MIKFYKAMSAIAAVGLGAAMYIAMPASAELPKSANEIAERAGTSVIVGTKKAVAYYEKATGGCKVTVLMSETYPEQLPYNLPAVRFSASVAAQSAAEIGTSDGAVLTLKCAKNASAMSVEASDMPKGNPMRLTN